MSFVNAPYLPEMTVVTVITLLLLGVAGCRPAVVEPVEPAQPAASAAPLTITADTVLEKYATITQPIIIAADGVTLDGNGATIQGPGVDPSKPDTYVGIGIKADGVSNVTIRNIKVRGFAVAISVSNAGGWVIEDNYLSDNYTDPEWGWGRNGRQGGIVLTDVHKSVIRRNVANRVWNALDMSWCDDNEIDRNDFGHCSNSALVFWGCSRNKVTDNNFSYGIRLRPGEKHARDSAGVMIECASNDNVFLRNDMTYGGDGMYIRVYNDRVCTGNVFIENDASYANNNCFECLCPGNTFIRNKANHGSYGFWLAGADRSVLIENEAGWNGRPEGNHNAPEPLFDFAGITMVSGSSYHSTLIGNYCHDNNGPGIAIRGDLKERGAKWRTSHYVIQGNRLENNRWGVHAQFVDMMFVSGNECSGNGQDYFFDDVTQLTLLEKPLDEAAPPVAKIAAPTTAKVGDEVTFDASAGGDPSGGKLRYEWNLGGQAAEGPRQTRRFDEPGYYRISLTVSDGGVAGLAWHDLYVVPAGEEIGTESGAAAWQAVCGAETRVAISDCEGVCGSVGVKARVEPYMGGEVELRYRKDAAGGTWDLSGRKRLLMWVKTELDGPRGFRGLYPVVTLRGKDGLIRLTPRGRLMFWDNALSEARWSWRLISVDLAGEGIWSRETEGDVSLSAIESIGVGATYSDHPQEAFTIYIDGIVAE